jgi:phosphoribosylamine--glycine ligase
MAAAGYPGPVQSGDEIHGLERALPDGVRVFHGGTRLEHGKVITAGGRVLTVCALGDDVAGARERAYRALAPIRFDGAFWRRDIAWRALGR